MQGASNDIAEEVALGLRDRIREKADRMAEAAGSERLSESEIAGICAAVAEEVRASLARTKRTMLVYLRSGQVLAFADVLRFGDHLKDGTSAPNSYGVPKPHYVVETGDGFTWVVNWSDVVAWGVGEDVPAPVRKMGFTATQA